MKAIVIAAVAIVAVALTVTVRFRQSDRSAGAGPMMKIFLGFLPLVIVAWSVTPDDLGVLPRTLLAEPPWLDLAGCLFFYAAAFGGGLLQLYNLADRGLSLRILADLHGAGGRAMTLDEIAERYGDGRGLGWMYDKRLDGLVRCRLVALDGGEVQLTARGWSWARRFAGLRRWLRLSSG